METKFGKWIESRGFPVTVNAVVILALGYMALRDANALDWGLHRSLYGPVFLGAGVVLLLFFTLLQKYHCGFPGACRRVAAYLLCFLIYDVPALLVCDLAAALFGLGRPVRAGLIQVCTCFAGGMLLYGSLHGHTRSIISAGTGFFGLPVRIGTDSEVVVIHLQDPQKTAEYHS